MTEHYFNGQRRTTPGTWMNRDEKILKISEMSEAHLKNALRHVRKYASSPESNFEPWCERELAAELARRAQPTRAHTPSRQSFKRKVTL